MRWTDTHDYRAFGRESRQRASVVKSKFRCPLARCGAPPFGRPIDLMAIILCGRSNRYAHRAGIENAHALWFHSFLSITFAMDILSPLTKQLARTCSGYDRRQSVSATSSAVRKAQAR